MASASKSRDSFRLLSTMRCNHHLFLSLNLGPEFTYEYFYLTCAIHYTTVYLENSVDRADFNSFLLKQSEETVTPLKLHSSNADRRFLPPLGQYPGDCSVRIPRDQPCSLRSIATVAFFPALCGSRPRPLRSYPHTYPNTTMARPIIASRMN